MRLMLLRPLTLEVLHPEVQAKDGQHTEVISGPGDITFTLPAAWRSMIAADGHPVLLKGGTMVVAERDNGTIAQVGIVDNLSLSGEDVEVSAGGFSVVAPWSGPWEGSQGEHVDTDPVTLFRSIWEGVQAHPESDLGIRVTGDTTSGGTVGSRGSARWLEARTRYRTAVADIAWSEADLLKRERALSDATTALFKAAGAKFVGQVNVSPTMPDNDAQRRMIWIREDTGRPWLWVTAEGRFVSQSQAEPEAAEYRAALASRDWRTEAIAPLQTRVDEAQDDMELYAAEAEESWGLWFHSTHNVFDAMTQLTGMGPFQWREHAAWDGDGLDLQIVVGAPRLGVRREDLLFTLGHNIHTQPLLEGGDVYTALAQFGAGEGSDTLSQQISWDEGPRVRRVAVETDKDAVTQSLVRASANATRDRLRAEAGAVIRDLIVHDTDSAPLDAFGVGDSIRVTGTLSDGSETDGWHRITSKTTPWGGDTATLEVEPE